MEVLLILAVVVGVAVGVGLTTWQLSRQDMGGFVWAVDAADGLTDLEKHLNDFSERGFVVHRVLSGELSVQQSTFVIIGRRSEHAWLGPRWRGRDSIPSL